MPKQPDSDSESGLPLQPGPVKKIKKKRLSSGRSKILAFVVAPIMVVGALGYLTWFVTHGETPLWGSRDIPTFNQLFDQANYVHGNARLSRKSDSRARCSEGSLHGKLDEQVGGQWKPVYINRELYDMYKADPKDWKADSNLCGTTVHLYALEPWVWLMMTARNDPDGGDYPDYVLGVIAGTCHRRVNCPGPFDVEVQDDEYAVLYRGAHQSPRIDPSYKPDKTKDIAKGAQNFTVPVGWMSYHIEQETSPPRRSPLGDDEVY